MLLDIVGLPVLLVAIDFVFSAGYFFVAPGTGSLCLFDHGTSMQFIGYDVKLFLKILFISKPLRLLCARFKTHVIAYGAIPVLDVSTP